MSLFVRVACNFYSHRKTLRLRAMLADDALWVPPRLWAYAAEHFPDGLIRDLSATELALAIGYTKDAISMLQALLAAGFLDDDPLRIHDWAEHNGYHKTYADRARLAAKARWEKERTKEKEVDQESDRKGKEASIATSMLVASGDDPIKLRLGALFKRRPGTKWSDKEVKAFKAIGPITEEDLLLIEAYYTAAISKHDYRRRDLCTLLNNFPGEVDRARNFKLKTQKPDHSQPF